MAYPVFNDLYNDIVTNVGLVAGTSVQAYTQPMAKLAVNRAFNFLWDKHQWDDLWTWEQYNLDGVTGLILETITNIKRWEDITDVRIGGQSQSISRPAANEHTNTVYTSGATPRWRTVLNWDHAFSTTKFFKFWPITATGPVDMFVGHRPDRFEDDDDIVPMDYDLMVDGGTWFLLKDDGTNPESAVAAQTVFDTNFRDKLARQATGGIGYGRTGRRNGSTVLISP